jgi:hypothetical protein
MPETNTLPPVDPTAPTTLRDAAKLTGWGLAFWAAVQLAGALFEGKATAAIAAQAAVAEWGAGRMGIAWSDPLARLPPRPSHLAKRAAFGALLGGVAAAAVVLAAILTGGAARSNGPASPGILLIGLLLAALGAVRDELLLRGLVLRVTRGLLPAWVALLACGGAAAAACYGASTVGSLGGGSGGGVDATALAVAALGAIALGALWMHDRGAWMAWGAHTAWVWTLESVVRGGVLDVRFGAEPEASRPAVGVVAAAATIATVWVLRGGPSAASPRGGLR